ncbi:MAG: suppressor of tub2 mutation [Pleopsidium flavum]|nr:MAG: suppressor of tub2 mutation [Pleopsidium flavum]
MPEGFTNRWWQAALGCLTLVLTVQSTRLIEFSYFVLVFLYYFEKLPTLVPAMDRQAMDLLAVIRNANASIDDKANLIGELKSNIKHQHVPDAAVAPSFEVVRTAIASPHSSLLAAGFSTLSHLTKRLILQNQPHLIVSQGTKTYPLLLEKFGDQKDRVRLLAAQAFTDFWFASPQDVEHSIRDIALAGKHPRSKEASLQWLVKMHKEQGLQFRTFVPIVVDCLEDADGSVRETAKVTVVELFQRAPDYAKADLKKHLQQRNVRKTIATYILTQLGLVGTVDPELKASTQSHNSDPPRHEVPKPDASNDSHPPPPAISSSENQAEKMEPAYVNTYRELEDIFSDMHPHFEGKESDQNWTAREKSVLKLRKLTQGNAPHNFTVVYLAGIKGLLDGILKTVNSLRTTVSTNGCHLVQEIAKAAGSGLDPMVEILLQNLIKLCGGTKKISAQNGNVTVDAILANVTYNVRLMQHVWIACQDKNVQPRTYATVWLRTLITNHAHHKSTLEHAGGLDLIEKCVKKGLGDANPGVKESMRGTYWAFARLWPEKSEAIMSALDATQQGLLEKHPGNPNPSKSTNTSAAVAGRPAAFSRSTNAIPARSSLKDTIAAQKKAKLAGKDLPERPGSAQSSFSPVRPSIPSSSSTNFVRPSTAMSTANRTASSISTTTNSHSGTLSSAPVRPMRPARRPEMKRPATADPYASRKPLRTETPALSPAVSPVKAKTSTPAPTTGTVKGKALPRKVENSTTSPGKGTMTQTDGPGDIFVAKRAATAEHTASSPLQAYEDFTMLIPSLKAPNSLKTIPGEDHTRSGSGKPKDLIAQPSMNGHVPSTDDEIPPTSEPLIVYEDPVQVTDKGTIPRPVIKTTALEELPVNEPAIIPILCEQSPNTDNHRGWKKVEAAEKQKLFGADLQHSGRLLDSGIVRVRARTLDVHGFRKLQVLIKGNDDIWDDGAKFEDLFLALLDSLEAPYENSKGKGQDSKAQVLITIRLMLTHLRKYFSTLYPRVLCAILTAGKYYDSTSHMACGLEEMAEEAVALCKPDDGINAVLNLLEGEKVDTDAGKDQASKTMTMGLNVLAGLLPFVRKQQVTLTEGDTERLTALGLRCLGDTNPDVRRAVIEYSLVLHDLIDIKCFWTIVAGARKEHGNLLMYYLAKRAKGREV